MNSMEAAVKRDYEEKGWTVYTSGWPDLLAFRVVEGKPEIKVKVEDGTTTACTRPFAISNAT